MRRPAARLLPLLPLLRRFAQAREGATTILLAVSALGLLGVAGAAVDYAQLSESRAKLQAVADASALAGAKEFRLGNASAQTVTQVMQNFALAQLRAQSLDGGASVAPSVDSANKTVMVTINAQHPTYLMQAFGIASMPVSVAAKAKVVGGAPICVIGLDAAATQTVLMEQQARLEAPGCAVYSNSQKALGLMAKQAASMRAAFICSGGGKSSPGPGSFTPTPQTDCPVLPDPLAARPQPAIGPCAQNNLVISGGSATLTPGTYCGGLSVTNGAQVTLSPGIYVFRNGPLSVTSNGTLRGDGVGLFFSGAGAIINFAGPTTIALSAPTYGDMAGMLVFEDRASPEKQIHQVLSDNARNLLGTIYLPRNELHVAANSPVADQSAYTIVVARIFTLSAGPTMVLNTNYSATTVPVPAGLGPNANRTMLVN